jgi:hypothetical protein
MRMLVYASRYTRVEDLIAYIGGRTAGKNRRELRYLQTSKSDVFFIRETEAYDVEHRGGSLLEVYRKR